MPVFELGETSQQPGTEQNSLFGVWSVASPATTAREPVGALSFSVLGGQEVEPTPDIPVWRARLPANPTRAAEQLTRSQSQIAASRQALPEAKNRLDTLARRGRETHDTRIAPGMHSFSTEQEQPSPDATLHQLRAASDGAEAILLDGLLDINQGGDARDQVSSATLGPGMSFGIGETIGEWGEALHQHVQGFASQVAQAFSAYARVETEIGERAIAHTTVRWTGDVETVWRSGSSADYAEYLELHGEALTLAISSRDALVQTIVLTATSAIKLSFLITTPTGVVLAMPKLWEYINRILKG